MLADMAIGVETARLATYRAGWEVDQVSTNISVLLCYTFEQMYKSTKTNYQSTTRPQNKEAKELPLRKVRKISLFHYCWCCQSPPPPLPREQNHTNSIATEGCNVFAFFFTRAAATLTLRPSPSAWPEMSLTSAPQMPYRYILVQLA